jgi:hypothetical protein
LQLVFSLCGLSESLKALMLLDAELLLPLEQVDKSVVVIAGL